MWTLISMFSFCNWGASSACGILQKDHFKRACKVWRVFSDPVFPLLKILLSKFSILLLFSFSSSFLVQHFAFFHLSLVSSLLFLYISSRSSLGVSGFLILFYILWSEPAAWLSSFPVTAVGLLTEGWSCQSSTTRIFNALKSWLHSWVLYYVQGWLWKTGTWELNWSVYTAANKGAERARDSADCLWW